MTPEVSVISDDNLSTAWAKAFLKVMHRGVKELTPLVVTVICSADGVMAERDDIRDLLDTQIMRLKTKDTKLQLCHTVANTIFPRSLWNPNLVDDAQQLFERFDAVWPRIKRCAQNRRGSYFRRLTAYRPNGDSPPVNQLAHIAATFRGGNHRRSALQAAVFDPALDHTNAPLLGFPCLHQVAFSPLAERGLAVTAFYATQYIFDRAYGNYLGLSWLGDFMARQMDLRLVRITCVASVAQIGTPTKNDLRTLAEEVHRLIDKRERTG